MHAISITALFYAWNLTFICNVFVPAVNTMLKSARSYIRFHCLLGPGQFTWPGIVVIAFVCLDEFVCMWNASIHFDRVFRSLESFSTKVFTLSPNLLRIRDRFCVDDSVFSPFVLRLSLPLIAHFWSTESERSADFWTYFTSLCISIRIRTHTHTSKLLWMKPTFHGWTRPTKPTHTDSIIIFHTLSSSPPSPSLAPPVNWLDNCQN